MSAGDVVVVTGGAGLLGQHIVHLLQEKTSVREIRVFDVREYHNNFGHEERVPVKSIVADLRKLSDLEEAFRGADVVFHTASLVNVAAFPDYGLLEEINVKGTLNVITACVNNNVSRLIYSSSIDVVVDKSFTDMHEAEETAPYPRTHISGGYAGSKCRAEQLVLAANGRELSEGEGHLRTVAVRPVTMYGEQDCNFLPNLFKAAKGNGGTFLSISKMGIHSLAYAGNTAWGHIVASQTVKNDPKVSGQAFFITDDSPSLTFTEFAKPFFAARGFCVSKVGLPFWVMYSAVCLLQLVCLLLQPVWRGIGPSVHTRSCLIHISRNLTFSGKKAQELLGYKPLYSYQQSLKNSMSFYEHVPI